MGSITTRPRFSASLTIWLGHSLDRISRPRLLPHHPRPPIGPAPQTWTVSSKPLFKAEHLIGDRCCTVQARKFSVSPKNHDRCILCFEVDLRRLVCSPVFEPVPDLIQIVTDKFSLAQIIS
jgi:hypothetical protein